MTFAAPSLEAISERLRAGVPGCRVETVVNGSPSAQHSLLIDREHGLAAARLLRDELQCDFCSNATAVDWLDREAMEDSRKTAIPGYLEMVYHLFSVSLKTGPVVIRMRTANRTDDVTLPSLTPIWRSAEFQEREAFDLFGVVFSGHPDLRRILMWDDYSDHPMRKDYVPPPDEEGPPQEQAMPEQAMPDRPILDRPILDRPILDRPILEQP